MNLCKSENLAFIEKVKNETGTDVNLHIAGIDKIIDHLVTFSDSRENCKQNIRTAIAIDALCGVIYETFDYKSYKLLDLCYDIIQMPTDYTLLHRELYPMLTDALLHYASVGDPKNDFKLHSDINYTQVIENIERNIFNRL